MNVVMAGGIMISDSTMKTLYLKQKSLDSILLSWAYGGGNTNPVAILRDGGRAKTDADELSIMEVVKVDILKGWDVSAIRLT